MVSFHAETANGQAFRLIDNIRSAGMKCGLVVNPETQLDIVTLYLDRVDKVTIMTVDPGFAGQAFISAMLKKIAAFAEYRQQHQLEFLIEVDGSCNKNTYSALMNPLMILVKIIKLRWIHILSYDQMVSRKINNQTTRCANSIFYTTLFTNSALNYT